MEPRQILDNLVDVSAGCICIESKDGECICAKEKLKALSQLASWVRGKKHGLIPLSNKLFIYWCDFCKCEVKQGENCPHNYALESIAKELEA